MAKLACVLVLALFALQGNSTLLKQVNIELPEGVIVFSDKVKEIKEKYNLEAVVEEVKEELKNALDAHVEDERLCKPEAQKFLDTLVKDTQTSADVCDNNVQEFVTFLKEKFDELKSQMFELTNTLANNFNTCKKEHPRDVMGFFACVEKNSKAIRQQIVALEAKIQQLSEYALNNAQDSLNKYDECLSEVKNKLMVDGRAIVSALDKCIQNADKLFFRMLCDPLCDNDFLDYSAHSINKTNDLHKVVAQMKEDVQEMLKVKVKRHCWPVGEECWEFVN